MGIIVAIVVSCITGTYYQIVSCQNGYIVAIVVSCITGTSYKIVTCNTAGYDSNNNTRLSANDLITGTCYTDRNNNTHLANADRTCNTAGR